MWSSNKLSMQRHLTVIHTSSFGDPKYDWHAETNVVICTLPEDVSVFRPRPQKSLNFAIVTQGSGSMRTHLMVIRTFRQLEASEPVDTQRPMWSSAPFPEMSVSSDRDREKVSILLSWPKGPVARGHTLGLSEPFVSKSQVSPLTHRDQCGHLHPSQRC